MYLKDIEIGRISNVEPFALPFPEAFHLCDLFLRLLGKYDSGKAGKVVINLVDRSLVTLNGFTINQDRPERLLNITTIHHPFPFEIYDSSPVDIKKQMIWEALYRSLVLCSQAFSWNTEPLKNTYEKGLVLQLRNEYFFGNIKYVRNGKIGAIILNVFDLFSFQSFAVFYDATGGEIKRMKIMEELASFGWYEARFFKKTKWISITEFALIDKYNKEWVSTIE
ncbi:MAG: hypothetical protein JSS76_16535 [Bacteroidetes bacterium]|nr:hypothetical protein [Bacteroidota bacterium]